MRVSHSLVPILVSTLIAGHTLADGFTVDWTQRYNGPANTDDRGYDVAVDDAGNTYVVGHEFEEFTAGGTLYSPAIMTLKYDNEGALEWRRLFRVGSTAAATGYHIAVDANGDIVIGGAVSGNDDWVALKYNAAGDLQWSTIYNANSTFLTEPDDMQIDAAGNIYMTGYVGSSLNPDFAAVWKLNAAGATQWLTEYYGPTFDGAFANAIAVDTDGNVYIAGGAVVPGRGSDAAVAAFDSDGNLLWDRTFGYPGTSTHDRFTDVAVDHAGQIVAVGGFGFNSFDGSDVAVVKLSDTGATAWQQTFGEIGLSNNETASHVAIGGDNSIYFAGTDQVNGQYDILVARYAENGAIVWEQTHGDTGEVTDFPTDLAVDDRGDAYIAGTVQPFSGANFYFLGRFDAATGALVADATYGGPMDGGSGTSALALGADQSVVITGDSFGGSTEDDAATIRYVQPSNAQPATLLDFELRFGSLDGGDLAALAMSDDTYLLVRSQFGFSAQAPNIAEVIVGFESPTSSPADLACAVELKLSDPGGTGRIRLRNWQTTLFEEVAMFATSRSDALYETPAVPAANYVRAADGRIEQSLRVSTLATFSVMGFVASIDVVETTVAE